MELQEETKESESNRLDVTVEPAVGEMCLEDRGRIHEPRRAGGLRKLKKIRMQVLP